jgi:hypothetical protein
VGGLLFVFLGQAWDDSGRRSVSELFELLVAKSELSPLFGRAALRRACERAGVDAERLSPLSLRMALPEIEKTLRMFLDTRAEAVMRELEALTRSR